MFKTVTAKGDATRARIYGAALNLFRTKGFDAATMRDVAAAAELSLGAAYHYFPSKDAIAVELLRRYRDGLVALVGARRGAATPATFTAVVRDLIGELHVLQSMVDRQAVSYFLHTPEVPAELQATAVASANRWGRGSVMAW